VHFVVEHLLGFRVIKHEGCTDAALYWSDLSLTVLRVQRLLTKRCVCNHFPGIEQLCRKVPMARLLTRLAAEFPKDYDFVPLTFTSYEEYVKFRQHRKSPDATTTTQQQFYICKPNGGCQGRNIFLTSTISPHAFEGAVSSAVLKVHSPAAIQAQSNVPMSYVVQHYIDGPMLVMKRKCDLRCYVLVTSMSPLTMYFYREGIVRICRDEYEAPNSENKGHSTIHLANYAVNKSQHTDSSCDPHDSRRLRSQDVELKWPFHRYSTYVLKHILSNSELLNKLRQSANHTKGVGYSVAVANDAVRHLWEDIHDVCVKTVLASQHVIAPLMRFYDSVPAAPLETEDSPTENSGDDVEPAASPNGPLETPGSAARLSPCFELLGFDILVDDQLKPWLVEVNHSPSWFTDSAFDFELKSSVIHDALRIAFLPHLTTDPSCGRQGRRRTFNGPKTSNSERPNDFVLIYPTRDRQVRFGDIVAYQERETRL